MKRKILIGAVVMISLMNILGCRKEIPDYNAGSGSETQYAAGRELMCLADSREKAEEVAAQYGIELVDYKEGVATFHTDEDPYKIIELGKKNGYQELAVNNTSQTFNVPGMTTDQIK